MPDRLAQLRELAVQSTHYGERVNALRAAAREQRSSFAFEEMICRMEQRARIFEDAAKGCLKLDAELREMAAQERDLIARSFVACGRG